jgi:hypothetical protein
MNANEAGASTAALIIFLEAPEKMHDTVILLPFNGKVRVTPEDIRPALEFARGTWTKACSGLKRCETPAARSGFAATSLLV